MIQILFVIESNVLSDFHYIPCSCRILSSLTARRQIYFFNTAAMTPETPTRQKFIWLVTRINTFVKLSPYSTYPTIPSSHISVMFTKV